MTHDFAVNDEEKWVTGKNVEETKVSAMLFPSLPPRRLHCFIAFEKRFLRARYCSECGLNYANSFASIGYQL